MKKVFFWAVILLLASMAVFAQEQAPEQEQEQEQVQTQQAQTQEPEPESGPKEKPVELYLSFITGGIGIHIPLALEGSVELIRLGFEVRKAKFGASISPFYLLGWVGGRTGRNDEGFAVAADTGASFINPAMYWNAAPFLFPDNKTLLLGPYADFNWLFINFLNGMIDTGRFRFSAGLQYGERKEWNKTKYNVFSVEVGYLLDGNHTPRLQGGTLQIGPNDHKFSVKFKFGR